MDVSAAVNARHSVRQFTDQPVDPDLLRDLVEAAARAPSGGNLQPWRIYVVNGPSMVQLREFLATQPPLEEPEYNVYPPNLFEPYRTNRYRVGEMIYGELGIPREDKEARLRQFAKNNDFFGAPAALFCYVDRRMGPPQWSDLGMYLQTFMLLAVERGLGTCPQEYWAVRHGAVSEFLGVGGEFMLFTGMSIGYEDQAAAVNRVRTERMPLQEWAEFK